MLVTRARKISWSGLWKCYRNIKCWQIKIRRRHRIHVFCNKKNQTKSIRNKMRQHIIWMYYLLRIYVDH